MPGDDVRHVAERYLKFAHDAAVKLSGLVSQEAIDVTRAYALIVSERDQKLSFEVSTKHALCTLLV